MERNIFLICLTVINPIVYAVATIFNSLSGTGSKDSPIFRSSTGDISDKYYLEITPAGWMFSIWGVIYVWEAIWIVYTIVNLFRKSEEGPVYCNPVLLPPAFFISFIINMCFNLAWIFLFDREEIEIAFPVLFIIAFTLYLCLFFSYRQLDKISEYLVKVGRTKDIWLIRILVHNGLGVYAAWTSIATLLNMAMVMIYRSDPGVSNENACTVALCFLLVELLVFAIVDLVFLDRYTRYTVTPYVVVPFALGASLAKNYTAGARNSIITLVLLGVAFVILVTKVIVLIWRVKTKPLLSQSVTLQDVEKTEKVPI